MAGIWPGITTPVCGRVVSTPERGGYADGAYVPDVDDVSGYKPPVCTSQGRMGSVPGMKSSVPTRFRGQYAVASMLVLKSIVRVTMFAGIGQSRGGGRRL